MWGVRGSTNQEALRLRNLLYRPQLLSMSRIPTFEGSLQWKWKVIVRGSRVWTVGWLGQDNNSVNLTLTTLEVVSCCIVLQKSSLHVDELLVLIAQNIMQPPQLLSVHIAIHRATTWNQLPVHRTLEVPPDAERHLLLEPVSLNNRHCNSWNNGHKRLGALGRSTIRRRNLLTCGFSCRYRLQTWTRFALAEMWDCLLQSPSSWKC